MPRLVRLKDYDDAIAHCDETIACHLENELPRMAGIIKRVRYDLRWERLAVELEIEDEEVQEASR